MANWNPNNYVQSRDDIASQIRLGTQHFIREAKGFQNAKCSGRLNQDSFRRKLHMSMQGNSSKLLASIEETGDTAVLEPGNQLNQQITDFVDAIFRIPLGQKPQSDDFYTKLIETTSEDDEAMKQIAQNLERDFHIIEKAYLFLAESIEEGQFTVP